MSFDLAAVLGEVLIEVEPADATLLVDGEDRGVAPSRLELSSEPHRLELTKAGYEPAERTVRPRPACRRA